MSDTELDAQTPRPDRQGARTRLLDGMPVTERRIEAAGISTPLLEGGEGPPLMLLHGQGGFAPMWGLVIPELAEGHRVLAPDLPGLGESQLTGGELDATRVVAWLGELIEQTCDEPPTVVGHSLGGTTRPASRPSAEMECASWSLSTRGRWGASDPPQV